MAYKRGVLNPSGFCQCGCGLPTAKYRYASMKDGAVAGEHRRFLKGHDKRGKRKAVDYTEKRCRKCQRIQALEDFPPKKRMADGRNPRCRACVLKDKQDSYKRHRDAIRQRQKRYGDAHREEARERARDWHWANREKATAASRDHYWANREARLAYLRQHYQENSEHIKQRVRNYAHSHPEVVRAQGHRRRARKAAAPGTTSPRDLERLMNRFQGRCAYCDDPASSIDHVIPLTRGGTNWIGNLLPACRSCNSKKSTKLLVEWMYA